MFEPRGVEYEAGKAKGGERLKAMIIKTPSLSNNPLKKQKGSVALFPFSGG